MKSCALAEVPLVTSFRSTQPTEQENELIYTEVENSLWMEWKSVPI